eukprot:scaffold3291_cov94-Skeletonema_dohrnii-CCMP3373.AAC.6
MLPPCLKWLRVRGKRSRIDGVPEQDLTTDNLYFMIHEAYRRSPAVGRIYTSQLIHERAFSVFDDKRSTHESHRSCYYALIDAAMPRSSASGDTPLNS